MEVLRIKCPSCGVILEVKNSKNEAVKKIKCPNCQKQLAITFADKPTTPTPPISRKQIESIYQGGKSIQLNEGINSIPDVPNDEAVIHVHSLANGDWKYVLQALSSEVSIKVNNQPLQKGDEVNLTKGDKYSVGQKAYSFGKPGNGETPKPVQQNKIIDIPDSAPLPSKEGSRIPWLSIAVFVGFLLLTAWYFWPSEPKIRPKMVETDSVVIAKESPKDTTPKVKAEDKKVIAPKPEKVEKKEFIEPSASSTNEYDLETKASKGDVAAQYKLGMKWVTSNDCSAVKKGVKYLEAAADKGNADAQYALGIIYRKGSPSCGISKNPSLSLQYMKMAAENGSSKARRFLESNDND